MRPEKEAQGVSAVVYRTSPPTLVDAIDNVRAVAEEVNMLSGIMT